MGAVTERLLAGEIVGDGPAQSPQAIAAGLRTRQAMLVDLLATYARHSVALAALLSHPGPPIEERLDPGTLAALAGILPVDGDRSWLDEMRTRLHSGRGTPGAAPAL